MDIQQPQQPGGSSMAPTSGFAPVPASPAAVPGIPESAGQPPMAQEEMITSLRDLMAKIQGKMGDFNSGKAVSESKLMQAKSQSLREVFDLLQSLGIDPSNVEDVQAFLDKIKENNPELYQQVEKVLSEIIGGDTTDPGTSVDTGQTPQDLGAAAPAPEAAPAPDPNMNINNTNETSPQNI